MNANMTITRLGDTPVLKLTGEWTGRNAPILTHRLDALCGTAALTIVLDLAETTFIDSHGLGIFVYYWKMLRESGRRLVLLRPRGFMQQMLESTRLDQVFTVVEEMELL